MHFEKIFQSLKTLNFTIWPFNLIQSTPSLVSGVNPNAGYKEKY